MATICPSCDQYPGPEAVAGSACSKCGTSLIALAAAIDPLIGTVIDKRFEVLEKLGQGGMGTVFRARQQSIGRDVALKVIDRSFDRDVAVVKRFFREAQLASKLAHPNTIGIIEFGQAEDGRPYLAMELVRGRTLDQALREDGAFSLERVVRVGLQICDALIAAHAMAIVHRDLKLDNVMMLFGEGDHIKVLDFGLARSLLDPESRATATGIVAGTPRFMAPEAAAGAEPTPAQDTYALGVILAELAINAPLWTETSVPALFVAKATPDVGRVPGALRTIVGKLLSPALADRPTAREARTLLAELDTRAPSIDVVTTAGAESLAAPTTSAFEAPDAKPEGLALEAEWTSERAAKQAAAAAPPPKPKRRIGGIIAAVVVGGALASGIYYATRSTTEEPPRDMGGRMVAITITADHPVEIKIDSRSAGVTPLTFRVGKSSTKHVVTATIAGVVVSKEIVADGNKIIDMTAPP